jgi:hypothetical protein
LSNLWLDDLNTKITKGGFYYLADLVVVNGGIRVADKEGLR